MEEGTRSRQTRTRKATKKFDDDDFVMDDGSGQEQYEEEEYEEDRKPSRARAARPARATRGKKVKVYAEEDEGGEAGDDDDFDGAMSDGSNYDDDEEYSSKRRKKKQKNKKREPASTTTRPRRAAPKRRRQVDYDDEEEEEEEGEEGAGEKEIIESDDEFISGKYNTRKRNRPNNERKSYAEVYGSSSEEDGGGKTRQRRSNNNSAPNGGDGEVVDDDDDIFEDAKARLIEKAKSSKRKSVSEVQQLFIPDFPSELVVEKIVAYRRVNKTNEYLVKWKGYSYLHVQWMPGDSLRDLDPNNNARRIDKYHREEESEIDSDNDGRKNVNDNNYGLHHHKKKKKKKRKPQQPRRKKRHDSDEEEDMVNDDDDDDDSSNMPLFNQEFTNVHRILAYYEEFGSPSDFGYQFDNPGQKVENEEDGTVTRYAYVLIKWGQLQYSELTWEPVTAIDSMVLERKLQEFRELDRFDYDQYHQIYAPMKKPVRVVKPSNFVKLTDETAVYQGFEDRESELKLRDYQIEGVNWLLWNWCQHRPGSLLADEMGLGKTIQCAAMLDELRSGRIISSSVQDQKWMRTRGPHLVVVPLSCIVQWERELHTWTKMNVVVYHGSQAARNQIKDYEFFYRSSKVYKGEDGRKIYTQEYTRMDILLTTYELAVREAPTLRQIKWRCLVVDEAHRLKNRESKLNRELQMYNRDYTVLLTGTPIQNNTEELWALMNFLTSSPVITTNTKRRKTNSTGDDEDEGFYFQKENRMAFLEEFGLMTSDEQVKKLHSLLRPFLLRRIKEDVILSLPPKMETIIDVELTVEQKKYYRAIFEKNTTYLFRGDKASNGPSLMNVVMELRKCCNHPFLVKGVEDALVSDIVTQKGLEDEKKKEEEQGGSRVMKQIRREVMINSAGKLVLLDKLLPKLRSGDHKVLIFSQMVRMLDILEEYCQLRQYEYERLDGTVTGIDRQGAIDRFSSPKSTHFIMLLSTRAGGLGLNLASADTVIIYDSDWNPQNDLQAQARSHRIGQTRAVKVYRLITRKTYEKVMFEKASVKLGLDKAMLERREEKGGGKKLKGGLSAAEVDHILKHGAYAAFGESEEDSTQASKSFATASIEEILEKSSHQVNLDPAAAEKASALGGAFSTVVFTNQKNTEETVDLDDPEFWTKVAGMEKPEEEDEELRAYGLSKDGILESGAKRERRAVVRMGMFGDEIFGDDDDDLRSSAKEKRKSKKQKQRLEREKAKALARLVKYRSRIDGRIPRPPSKTKAPWPWSDRAMKSLVHGIQKLGWNRWGTLRLDQSLELYGDEGRLERFASAILRVLLTYAKDEGAHPPERPLRATTLADKDERHRAKEDDPLITTILAQASKRLMGQEERQQTEKVVTNSRFIVKMLNGGARSVFERLALVERINLLVRNGQKAALKNMTDALTLSRPKRDPNHVLFVHANEQAGGEPKENGKKTSSSSSSSSSSKPNDDDHDDLPARKDHIRYLVKVPIGIHSGITFGLVPGPKGFDENLWVVRSIVEGSPADRSGFVMCGDIVRSVNGFATDQMNSIGQLMDAYFSPALCPLRKVPLGQGSLSTPISRKGKAKQEELAEMSDSSEDYDEHDHVPSDRATDDEDSDAEESRVCKLELETAGLDLVQKRIKVANSIVYGDLLVNSALMVGDQHLYEQVVDAQGVWKNHIDLDIIAVETSTAPSFNWTAAEVTDWIYPLVRGRFGLQPLEQYFTSRKSKVENSSAADICQELITRQWQEVEAKTLSMKQKNVKLEASACVANEVQWESLLADRTAYEMDRTGELGSGESFLDHLKLMEGTVRWTREMDYHLLIGISRFGLDSKEMDYIAADPTLIFAQMIGAEKARLMLLERKRQEEIHAERIRKEKRLASKARKEKAETGNEEGKEGESRKIESKAEEPTEENKKEDSTSSSKEEEESKVAETNGDSKGGEGSAAPGASSSSSSSSSSNAAEQENNKKKQIEESLPALPDGPGSFLPQFQVVLRYVTALLYPDDYIDLYGNKGPSTKPDKEEEQKKKEENKKKKEASSSSTSTDEKTEKEKKQTNEDENKTSSNKEKAKTETVDLSQDDDETQKKLK